MSAPTWPARPRLLEPDEIAHALDHVERSPDSAASVFLTGVLRDTSGGARVHGWRRRGRPPGVVALLPQLPPFSVPVILAAGHITSDDMRAVAAGEPSPSMALGPASVVEDLAVAWPSEWEPLVARRPEVLLEQPGPRPEPPADERIRVRPASPKDIGVLAAYRIAMETDSGTAIVSTPAQTDATVRALVANDALTVVEVDGEPAGCAAVTSSDDHHDQLGFVYVEARHRLRGVSDRLLSAVCRQSHSRGRTPICFTEADGPLAARLRVLGFVAIGAHLKLYAGRS